MLGLCIRCGLLLTLGCLQVSGAQEPSGKPEVPTPKTVQSSIPLPKYSPADSEPKKPGREPETVADLSALATSVAKYISVAGRQPKSCTVLVTDFTLPDGNTSAYGMQLADTLSRELTNKEYKLGVIDRRLLQTLLAKERVPAQSQHRAIIHWISDELDARFVVFGTTEKAGDGLVRLSGQLIDTNSKDWPVYSAIVNLGPLSSAEDLEPIEPFAPLPALTTSSSGEKLERAGINGTTMPSCTYIPNPPYSEEAMKLKISGSVTTEAVVPKRACLETMPPIGVDSLSCHPAESQTANTNSSWSWRSL